MLAASTTDRRKFIGTLSCLGLSSTLLPGTLWAKMAEAETVELTSTMVKDAASLAGLTFTSEQCETILNALKDNLERYQIIHDTHIPNDVAPPFYFSPIVAGMEVDRTPPPIRFSETTPRPIPSDLEELAFWSISDLAALIKTKAISSEKLTRMFLSRLHRLNEKLNCVVTFLDHRAIALAKAADADIAAGKYRGLLHGIPWGAKDIIAVKGHKTTWGSPAYQDQEFEEDAKVVHYLDEAGAVLIAKLSTGELASGDRWFGGRTNNPWNLEQGSSGSSAGPASATAAGCVPFAIGTETSGSIFSPSARCGATGLRPTFGRVSRIGVMALSWTQDRIGPICRYVEDCAIVMSAIAKPDGQDLSVSEIPFSWDATTDIRKLRVGYLQDAFADSKRNPEWVRNDAATLAKLRSMGIQLIPITLPDFPELDTLRLSVESAAFFDELTLSGKDAQLTVQTRGERFRSARLIPAVEYLQSQRLRAMMMAKLEKATSNVDVYLAPYGTGIVSTGPRIRVENTTNIHTQMANLAAYPGIALPNGFTSDGTPSSITFMGRPFGEAALMAVAKAYQDATQFNIKQPRL